MLFRSLVQKRAREFASPLVYVNQVGAQDDLVFDGDSVIVDSEGKVLARAPQFESDIFITDIEVRTATSKPDINLDSTLRILREDVKPLLAERLSDEEEMWTALVIGLRDYVAKNGFTSVALGLSGGIDSAVVASLAVDALGKDRVFGVSLPSKYSSEHSLSDAKSLALNLGIDYRVIEIEPVVHSFLKEIGRAHV